MEENMDTEMDFGYDSRSGFLVAGILRNKIMLSLI